MAPHRPQSPSAIAMPSIGRLLGAAVWLCIGAAAAVAQTAAPGEAAPAAAAPAATGAPGAVDLKKHPGRTVYLKKGACAACHGRDGAKGISYYPAIAGLDKKYLINQINDILTGKRKGGIDTATNHPRTESMVGALVAPDGKLRVDPTDIEQMADWLSLSSPGTPPAPETPIAPESRAAGEKLYAKCVACHGKEGKKPLKGYPHLAGQKRIYLVQQMTDIRDGIRTNGLTKLMLPFVKKLTDAEIGQLADYLAPIDRSAN